MIDQVPGDPFYAGLGFGFFETVALPCSNFALRYFSEVPITIFCLSFGSMATVMVAILGLSGGWFTLFFFYMSIFLCSASLNMYFMIVEVRVVPNVFGSIMELTICFAYFSFGLTVMISLMQSPW